MEFKFTNDGKKVVVIGNLNAQQKIVQEVFVVNGNEIPSGENFVVTSLHDAPAVSWKETETKRIEAFYEKTKKEYDTELDRLKKRFQEQKSLLVNMSTYAQKLSKSFSDKSLLTYVAFVTGKIKFVVINRYSRVEIRPFDSEFNSEDTWDIWNSRELKLFSFFGRDDGSLQLRVNQYYDGSGTWIDVWPFETYEEALQKATELILATEKYGTDTITSAKKYGIKLDPVKVSAFKQQQIDSVQNSINQYQGYIDKHKKELDNLLNVSDGTL